MLRLDLSGGGYAPTLLYIGAATLASTNNPFIIQPVPLPTLLPLSPPLSPSLLRYTSGSPSHLCCPHPPLSPPLHVQQSLPPHEGPAGHTASPRPSLSRGLEDIRPSAPRTPVQSRVVSAADRAWTAINVIYKRATCLQSDESRAQMSSPGRPGNGAGIYGATSVGGSLSRYEQTMIRACPGVRRPDAGVTPSLWPSHHVSPARVVPGVRRRSSRGGVEPVTGRLQHRSPDDATCCER